MSSFLSNIFSVSHEGKYKIIRILGIRITLKKKKKSNLDIVSGWIPFENTRNAVRNLIWNNLNNLNNLNRKVSAYEELFLKMHFISRVKEKMLNIEDLLNDSKSVVTTKEKNDLYLKYLFNTDRLCNSTEYDSDMICIWSFQLLSNSHMLFFASNNNIPVFLIEDGHLKSVTTPAHKTSSSECRAGISFILDDISCGFDATIPTRLEQMINDKNLIITDEQKKRARKCIDKIVKMHLTKYNHQPIFTPKIGRDGVKKILVVDQKYGDASIRKGLGSVEVFENMLECAIKENPDADIIVKTHPDIMDGSKGYYQGIKQEGNIYTQTEAINPISLINYCDKVYVCTTQLGFEALMCGKEVHVFGVPFYGNWGVTNDRQKLTRRSNARTLEELFYIIYIMYSWYVNPDKECRCEIEDAMDWLLRERSKYFKENNIRCDDKNLI